MVKIQSSFYRIAFLMIALLLFGASSSCEKYSSPKKVERIIVDGTWKLTSVLIDNIDMTDDFADYSFTFSKEGNIDVLGESTISGNWRTGIEKNPTTLNLTLTPFDPFFHLNADWTVATCKKDRMTLELDGASSFDVLILSKTN